MMKVDEGPFLTFCCDKHLSVVQRGNVQLVQNDATILFLCWTGSHYFTLVENSPITSRIIDQRTTKHLCSLIMAQFQHFGLNSKLFYGSYLVKPFFSRNFNLKIWKKYQFSINFGVYIVCACPPCMYIIHICTYTKYMCVRRVCVYQHIWEITCVNTAHFQGFPDVLCYSKL